VLQKNNQQKILAAQLLGKTLGMDVFRVDVSMMVSKYIN
jgi:hypothetical protein